MSLQKIYLLMHQFMASGFTSLMTVVQVYSILYKFLTVELVLIQLLVIIQYLEIVSHGRT